MKSVVLFFFFLNKVYQTYSMLSLMLNDKLTHENSTSLKGTYLVCIYIYIYILFLERELFFFCQVYVL